MDSDRGNRDQILDAAERLFGSDGYARVTIRKVCQASGLPSGSVYHHFGSKSGLLKAVLERGTTEIFQAFPTVGELPGPPLEQLAAYYERASDLIVKRLPLFRIMASLRLHHSRDPEVTAILRENDQRAHSYVMPFIEAVAKNCGVTDPAECARELGVLNLVFVAGLVVSADTVGVDVRTGIALDLHRLVVASILDRSEAARDR